MPTKNKQQRKGRRGQSEPLQPPKVDLSVKFRHVFRFSNSSGATNQPVAVADLLGLLAVATGATAITSIISAIKIQKLVIRTPAAAAGQVTPAVQWLGLTYENPSVMSQTALGTADPTVLVSRPPKMADSSFWITKSMTAGTTICSVSAPQNSVIDLHATLFLTNAQTLTGQTPVTYSSSGLTAGYLYFGELDKNSGSAKFIPVQVSYYG